MSPGRWELLRAVGAMTVVAPPASDGIASSLGIGPVSAASFTDTFVLSLPPYAGIHLGPEGKLGGEGADRVAGMWRALGLAPPADADHLGSLLLLYAELGEVGEHTTGRRAALLWEHLWSWAPGYLSAVSSCSSGGLGEWADLALRVLIREITLARGALDLPLALRAAPDPLNPDDDLESVLDALTAPVRTGFILTYGDLRSAAHTPRARPSPGGTPLRSQGHDGAGPTRHAGLAQ